MLNEKEIINLGETSNDSTVCRIPKHLFYQIEYLVTSNELENECVKGSWSTEEDEQLIKEVERNGARRWGQIAKFIRGRNGKQVRISSN